MRFLPAIAGLIVSGVLFLMLVKSIEVAITEEPYYADFNADEWNKSHAKPLPMIRVLLKEEAFIGLTLEELTNKYGKPDSSYKGYHYNTTDWYLDIVLVMANDTVSQVEPYCSD